MKRLKIKEINFLRILSYKYVKYLKLLDEKFLFSFLKILLNFFRRLNNRKFKIKKILNYNYYIIDYLPNKNNELTKLCEKYGSDKGGNFHKKYILGSGHTYTDYYFNLFIDKKNIYKNIFECGIGTNNLNIVSNMGKNGVPGASLRVWRDFFTNADIYGADIDKDILFKENRIFTYEMNQLDKNSIQYVCNKITVEFDLVIDDGLHKFDANICLFENFFYKVKKDGYYIIEDVTLNDQKLFYKYFNNSLLNVQFVSLNSPAISGSSNLVVIKK